MNYEFFELFVGRWAERGGAGQIRQFIIHNS